MSDVKRYTHVQLWAHLVSGHALDDMVMAADFDALRTEFETFKADRLKAADEILEATAAHSKLVDALQDLLNERDQRLDDAATRMQALELGLGLMLCNYDDGVGREWEQPVLDFARTLCPAVDSREWIKLNGEKP
jgi:hypothetical protein